MSREYTPNTSRRRTTAGCGPSPTTLAVLVIAARRQSPDHAPCPRPAVNPARFVLEVRP